MPMRSMMDANDAIDGLDATARAWMERAVVAERDEAGQAVVDAMRSGNEQAEESIKWRKRAEAAEQALREIAANGTHDKPLCMNVCGCQMRARAALAGREEAPVRNQYWKEMEVLRSLIWGENVQIVRYTQADAKRLYEGAIEAFSLRRCSHDARSRGDNARFELGLTGVNIPLQRNTIPNSERGGFEMEGWAAEPSGAALQRAFIVAVQQWKELLKRVKNCDAMNMPEDQVESMVREIIVREGNLQQMQEKISLELGLPITY